MSFADARFCPQCGSELARFPPPGEKRPRLVCPRCSFVLYENPKVAAGTVPATPGGLVLIRRGVPPGEGLWSFPCGYVEIEETLEQTAVRETEEECGARVELEGLLGAYSYPPPRGDTSLRVVIVAYAARVVGGDLRAGDDAREVRVFPAADLPWDELAFWSTRDALKAWLGRFGSG
ncbi:MAG: NUDIX hydrolase [Planctomycetales bacterium]|nr:NUDIX hydrolase [Planctomycetales bacterium]